MYKPSDFRKGCPVCGAVSKSMTKKACDGCGAELIDLDVVHNSSTYSPSGKTLEWVFFEK